ncbi:hypothetical protein [Streptomyces sp. NPDC051109]|uniref:glycine-rich domain-containing protein n=1 Tax=Streptomyces sp. NPDC051109 TaxID=3365642 RepID=UPI0037AF66A9
MSAAPGPSTQAFTTSGENSFTVPRGVTEIRVMALGAGAGGGGGGGNNDGPLTGAGGAGGGAGATVSCVLAVEGGSTLTVNIGRGGTGGSAGRGKGNAGGYGGDGTGSTVRAGNESLVGAMPGEGGGGGGASWWRESGTGGEAGKPGKAEASWCKGTDLVLTSGQWGERGKDGHKHLRGGVSWGGAPAQSPRQCTWAGRGGTGGAGQGNDPNPHPHQAFSTKGGAGNDGCVVLTYNQGAAAS